MRQSLRHEIRGLQRRLGVTTIMVTHDQEEALAMADRIVVMNHGVVEQVGTPIEVYTRPRSPFVARFVGQMNFLEATAGERAGWARVGAAEMRHGAAGPLAAGTPVTLAIRPEEILVGPGRRRHREPAGHAHPRVQFLGPFTRLSLALADGSPALECDVAATAFAALGAAEGSELALSLRPDALRVFPAAVLATWPPRSRAACRARSPTASSATGWAPRTWSATRSSPCSPPSCTSSCSTRCCR